jgi:uncharacterized protein (DUF302 family)
MLVLYGTSGHPDASAHRAIALIDIDSDKEFSESLVRVQHDLTTKGYSVQNLASMKDLYESFVHSMPQVILCNISLAVRIQKILAQIGQTLFW